MIRRLFILALTAFALIMLYHVFSRLGTVPPHVNEATAPLQESADGMRRAPNRERALNIARPSGDAATPAPPLNGAQSDRANSASATKVFDIAIDTAHPHAIRVFRVKEHDPVTLNVTSDRAGTLEVHGYRKEVKTELGGKSTLSFVAIKTGRFPIDLHAMNGTHIEVTVLEVLPR